MGQVGEIGLADVLNDYFADPTQFYIGLCTDNEIATDAVYADLTEVTGSNYAQIPMTSFTVSTKDTDDRKATGNQVTFTATGTWTLAASWFMVRNELSGENDLICWNALSETYELENGQSISVIPIINAVG